MEVQTVQVRTELLLVTDCRCLEGDISKNVLVDTAFGVTNHRCFWTENYFRMFLWADPTVANDTPRASVEDLRPGSFTSASVWTTVVSGSRLPGVLVFRLSRNIPGKKTYPGAV